MSSWNFNSLHILYQIIFLADDVVKGGFWTQGLKDLRIITNQNDHKTKRQDGQFKVSDGRKGLNRFIPATLLLQWAFEYQEDRAGNLYVILTASNTVNSKQIFQISFLKDNIFMFISCLEYFFPFHFLHFKKTFLKSPGFTQASHVIKSRISNCSQAGLRVP